VGALECCSSSHLRHVPGGVLGLVAPIWSQRMHGRSFLPFDPVVALTNDARLHANRLYPEPEMPVAGSRKSVPMPEHLSFHTPLSAEFGRGGAEPLDRSRHDLAMGAALRAGTQPTLPPGTAHDK